MVCNFIQFHPIITKIKQNDNDIQEDPPKLDLGSRAESGLNTLGSTSKREKSPTKSMTSTTSYIHIPGFLGMVIIYITSTHVAYCMLHCHMVFCVLL